MKRLGVNIDHVATLRNARGETHPNLLNVAKEAINFGADFLVIGRPIIKSKNPLDTIKKINQSIQ